MRNNSIFRLRFRVPEEPRRGFGHAPDGTSRRTRSSVNRPCDYARSRLVGRTCAPTRAHRRPRPAPEGRLSRHEPSRREGSPVHGRTLAAQSEAGRLALSARTRADTGGGSGVWRWVGHGAWNDAWSDSGSRQSWMTLTIGFVGLPAVAGQLTEETGASASSTARCRPPRTTPGNRRGRPPCPPR